MRVIDDRGRLFRKINVIDFLVILFLFCLVPIFYFGYKILAKKYEVIAPEKTFIEIEIDSRFIKVKPELTKIISIGDKELNENGQIIGEIISLGQSVPYKYEFDIGEKQKITKKDPILKQIEAKLKLKTEVKDGQPYYKDSVIRIDSPIKFKTSKYSLITIPFEEEEKERIIDISVTLKDLDEDMLKEISVGDKEVDESGKTIAEILSLGKVENSFTEFDLGGANFVRRENNTKKQISTRMRLKCQMRGDNQLYFKGKKVEYTTPLELKINNYILTAIPYGEEEKEKWVSLWVKFSGVVPEIAESVQKGDIEKDAFEKTIARIRSIISNEPALLEAITGEGKFVTLSHPFKRDIVVSLDVLCVEKEGAYYYKDYLAKMGNNIALNTKSYSISGLIVGVEAK